MASSRPSRVSKTTALLLNKVASGTLEEFLGEEASDFPSFVDVDDFEERKPVATKTAAKKKSRSRDEDEEEESSFGSSPPKKSSSESSSSVSDEQIPPRKHVASVVKKPMMVSGTNAKVEKRKHSSAPSFKPAKKEERLAAAPTRQLPLRKSIEKRSVAEGLAVGDYVTDDKKLKKIVHRLKMADKDKDLRRDGEDPDPNARRIWDTKCHVLGKGLIVARSNIPNAGFGLFSTQDFEKGVLVTEYVGEEVTKERAFELRDLKKDQYVRSLKNGFCIDGNPWPALGESCAQMANDGRNVIANNCAFVAIHNRDKVQEKPRVYLKTLQFIPAGSELLASYGKRYWEFHSKSSDEEDDDEEEGEEEDKGANGGNVQEEENDEVKVPTIFFEEDEFE